MEAAFYAESMDTDAAISGREQVTRYCKQPIACRYSPWKEGDPDIDLSNLIFGSIAVKAAATSVASKHCKILSTTST